MPVPVAACQFCPAQPPAGTVVPSASRLVLGLLALVVPSLSVLEAPVTGGAMVVPCPCLVARAVLGLVEMQHCPVEQGALMVAQLCC